MHNKSNSYSEITQNPSTVKPKKILITFARSFLSLDLARQLHKAGHEVYLVDSMSFPIGRFSNCVKKFFKVPKPRFFASSYIDALVDIVVKNNIDFLLPVYEEISYISQSMDRFPPTCTVFCPPFKLFHDLHHKGTFQELLQSYGIDTLKFSILKHPSDLLKLDFTAPFAVKACYSRASQKVIKVIPGEKIEDLDITPHNPWIAQEWLEGKKLCTYTICHQGEIYAHATYPVEYAIEGNSCILFKSVEHPGIYEWIKNFVNKSNYTGQIAFDFIEGADGKLFTIECNPRATNGVLLFTSCPDIDKALFKQTTSTIVPPNNAKMQIATGMVLYGWKKNAVAENSMSKFLKTLCTTRDAIIRVSDLKPLVFQPLVFASLWKNSVKYKLSLPASFTYDHDWNGETNLAP